MLDEALDEVVQQSLPETEERVEPSTSSASVAVLSAAAAAALAACGGGGGGGGGGTASTPDTVMPGRSVTLSTPDVPIVPATDDAKISRFLQQAQFAATDADIAAVKTMGYAGWLQAEISKPFGLGREWLARYGSTDKDTGDAGNRDLDNTLWAQLMSTNDACRKRMALALSEILVVSRETSTYSFANHALAHYWDILCINAFGTYKELLKAVTLSVAMGYYLNTKGSVYKAGLQPDENYAREIMQLFTIGLVQLNLDGTPTTTPATNTYVGADVSALAHVFTGWDLDTSQGTNSPTFTRLPMKFTKAKHSPLAVSALGGAISIAAGADGIAALDTVLDALCAHNNTAPFISKLLIQRLVTSNPSSGYVQRVATKFRTTGGDLAQVFGAILLDAEARSTPNALLPNEIGKFREPIVRVVQWARTFGVASANGAWDVGDLSNEDNGTRQIGQSPMRSPTVFNFFRPGYSPQSSALSTGVVIPEFQIANEVSVGLYLNYMTSVIDGGLATFSGSNDMRAAYTTELALAYSPTAASPTALVNRLNLLLCANQLSAATVTAIVNAVATIDPTGTTATATAANKRKRVCAAILMVMACPEYLVQK